MKKRISDPKDAFLKLASTVFSLHNLGIYHVNLNPETILVNKQDNNLKLSDFSSIQLQESVSGFDCGQDAYLSPEIYQGLQGSWKKDDVWALGVLLVQLVTGDLPWKAPSTNPAKVLDLKEKYNFNDEFMAVLKEVFQPADKRIDALDLFLKISILPSFFDTQ